MSLFLSYFESYQKENRVCVALSQALRDCAYENVSPRFVYLKPSTFGFHMNQKKYIITLTILGFYRLFPISPLTMQICLHIRIRMSCKFFIIPVNNFTNVENFDVFILLTSAVLKLWDAKHILWVGLSRSKKLSNTPNTR